MPFQNERNFRLLFAATCYGVVYVATKLLHLPVLKYLPVERVWTFFPPEGAIVMSYYGTLINALIGFALGYVASGRPDVAAVFEEEGRDRLLARVCVGIYAFGFAYIFLHEMADWGFR